MVNTFMALPKRPMTLEAVMLHYLDDMDAKINGIQAVSEDKGAGGSKWSAYHPLFDQFFYRPSRHEIGAGPIIQIQKTIEWKTKSFLFLDKPHLHYYFNQAIAGLTAGLISSRWI